MQYWPKPCTLTHLTSLYPSAGMSAVAIALGNRHTCAIETGGGVRCWGANDAGQLGLSFTDDLPIPYRVEGDRPSLSHTLARF